MATYWIDPTLPYTDQLELDLAWQQYTMQMFLQDQSESEEEEFGDEPWEEGPQTPPLGPQAPRPRLVDVGGGLAVAMSESDVESESWDDAISPLSSEYIP